MSERHISLLENIEQVSIRQYEEERKRVDILLIKSHNQLNLVLSLFSVLNMFQVYLSKENKLELLATLLYLFSQLYLLISLMLSFKAQKITSIKSFDKGSRLLEELRVNREKKMDVERVIINRIKQYDEISASLCESNNKKGSLLTESYNILQAGMIVYAIHLIFIFV